MFFRTIFSCFPPTERKKREYKLRMMRQTFIEEIHDLAVWLINCGYDLQTLDKASYDDDSGLDLLALRFKKWMTRGWDRGIGEELPASERARILNLRQGEMVSMPAKRQ